MTEADDCERPENVDPLPAMPAPIWIVDPRPKLHKSDGGHINEDAAAALLTYEMRNPVSVRTLQRWRTDGNGPRYFKGGRHVWYTEADIYEWLANKCARATWKKAG